MAYRSDVEMHAALDHIAGKVLSVAGGNIDLNSHVAVAASEVYSKRAMRADILTSKLEEQGTSDCGNYGIHNADLCSRDLDTDRCLDEQGMSKPTLSIAGTLVPQAEAALTTKLEGNSHVTT